jgi:hypothetical protein
VTGDESPSQKRTYYLFLLLITSSMMRQPIILGDYKDNLRLVGSFQPFQAPSEENVRLCPRQAGQ